MLLKRYTKSGSNGESTHSGTTARNSVITIVDQALVSVTNFLTIIVLAKLSLDNVFASFALAWQAINYLRTTQERLISAPYLVFVHRPKQSLESLLGSNLSHDFLFSIASSVILLLTGVVMNMIGFMSDSAWGLIILAVAIPGILWRDHLRIVSFANFRSDLAFQVDMIASFIQILGIGLLAYSQQLHLVPIALVLGTAGILPVLFWFAASPLKIEILQNQLLADWLETWRYAKWLVFARCLGIGSYLIVPWIIAARMNDVATGAFAACLSLVGLSTMFVTGLNNFLQPMSLRAYHQGGKSALIKSMTWSGLSFAIVLVPLCLLYWLLGDQMLRILFKEAYAEHWLVVVILGVNVLSFSFAIVASNGLAAVEKPVGNFWGEFSNLIASSILATILIERFGLPGAATAITLGSIIASIVTIASFLQIIRAIPEAAIQIETAG